MLSTPLGTLLTMRALMLEVDEHLLAERHRLGLDKTDEMWEGVLHMVPAPLAKHGQIQAKLAGALTDLAESSGLILATQIGIIRAANDFRIPDLAVYRPDAGDQEGIKRGAELVIEVRSPGDESYEKLPWYFDQGCREVLIVDRDTLRVELFTVSGQAEPDDDGFVTVQSLGVGFGPVEGGRTLIVRTPDRDNELHFGG